MKELGIYLKKNGGGWDWYLTDKDGGIFKLRKKTGKGGGSPLKGTVSVISSDPPCKDGNARFTTVPLEAFLIKYDYESDINVFLSLKCLFSFAVSLRKWLAHSFFIRRKGENHGNKHFRAGFQGYRCSSGITIFALSTTWYYAYSHFKEVLMCL